MTLEDAIESYNFGFSVLYDGDIHKVLYGTECNHCGEYFLSERLGVYCKKCIVEYQNHHKMKNM